MGKIEAKQGIDTDKQRRELLAMIRGEDIVVAPLIGVTFEDTGEVYYWTPPTPAQLRLPVIVFPYDTKENWLKSTIVDEEQVLYDKYGRIAITREQNGKAEE